MPDPGHLSLGFENDAAFKRHDLWRSLHFCQCSVPAQGHLGRFCLPHMERASANQVWLSFYPDNTKGYHYNTCCPYRPAFAVVLSKKLKRVNCYNFLYPGRVKMVWVSGFWRISGRAVGDRKIRVGVQWVPGGATGST